MMISGADSVRAINSDVARPNARAAKPVADERTDLGLVVQDKRQTATTLGRTGGSAFIKYPCTQTFVARFGPQKERDSLISRQ
jgi:hypothetical protein